MKKLLAVLLLALFVIIAPDKGAAETGKVGILFSDTINDYMLSTNPESYNGFTNPFSGNKMTVSAKVPYSETNDKANKLYRLYEQQGFQVAKVSHNELNSLAALNEYDVIVFPYSVLMNHTQRENVKAYVYGGGNVQIMYATGRNELDEFKGSSATKPDMTPLIYKTLTWTWEWDNMTELFQTNFIDDSLIRNVTITNNNVTHPILTRAYQLLGRNYIQLKDTAPNGGWIETVRPYGNIQPLLVYKSYSTDLMGADRVKLMNESSRGALFAHEYGAGRVVYATFKIYDYAAVDGYPAWYNLEGEQDTEAVLQASVEWLLQNNNSFKQRDYNVQLVTKDLTANMTPNQTFAVRGTVSVQNVSTNVPVRGKLKVQLVNANGTVLGNVYERVITGLAPAGSYTATAHDEKFQILVPTGSIPDGSYTLKATFEETRFDKKGFITKAETKTMTKKGNYGSYTNVAGFKDVSAGSHLANINNAAKIGIITGYSNGTFLPSNNVSRLQAMTMMLRAMGVAPSSSATLPNVVDIQKGAYGYDVLATAYQYGLINIEAGNKINATAPMRRGEMAQALVKGFKLIGSANLQFTDIGTASSYAQYKHIETLYHHRITEGKTATTYGTYDPVTRAQFATFIMRALSNSAK